MNYGYKSVNLNKMPIIQKVASKRSISINKMKFLSAIIFALFFLCAVQAQRGFFGNRRGQKPFQGGGGGAAPADCPNFCPLNYQPTCGFNGRCYKEFSNTCALNVAACNGEGKFRQVNIQECSKPGVRTC